MAKIVKDLREWMQIRRELKASGKSIGFVPTMGALHSGHGSLLERSRKENDVSLLSIYVNPTQFDNKEDLEKYPITLEADAKLAEGFGTDFILSPTYAQMYPDAYRYRVTEGDLSRKLCGAHRPGHFDGVLTVVMKLLNLAGADRAYFGEKDFQQLELVRGMAEAFFMETQIVPCPTVREADGLALSSRNVRLTAPEREKAPLFHKVLTSSNTPEEVRRQLNEAGFRVDYVEDVGRRRYGAAHLGNVRLIDNVER